MVVTIIITIIPTISRTIITTTMKAIVINDVDVAIAAIMKIPSGNQTWQWIFLNL